ncbi:MAG TPA: aldo/keto reductase [Burkholderiaceae bacterium]
MRQIALPGHSFALPALGLGTWRMGEAAATRRAEVAAVRTALELGYRLLDTAEMYGEGGAEEVVGEALAQALRAGDVRREEVVVVSKVLPQNASRAGTQAACDRSRRRLGLDRIDLYLLHWRGPHPLHDTLDGLRALADAGAIGRWGVSNFDVDDLEELAAVAGPDECATNQVWYSLRERGPEFALLPWMRERAMPLMAYSPIDMGDAARDPVLAAIGESHGTGAAAVALAAVLAQPGVVAIPKSADAGHLRENLAALELALGDEDRRRIDERFPPPRRRTALAMN